MPEINPLSLLLTIIGGLAVAGLLGWIRKPRLVALVPRTFLYSHITDKGQLVEISILNRGFKTEEAIDVTLNPAYSYDMLGSNSQDVSAEKNKIKISRIGPSDEITALVIVEHGVFKRDDIFQILSKETKGRTVSKLEEVPPTGPQRVGLVAFFVAIPVMLYLGYTGLNYVIKTIDAPVVAANSDDARLHGWNIPSYNRSNDKGIYDNFKARKITADIGRLIEKGDVVAVPFIVRNDTEKVISFAVSMTTVASEAKIPSYERHVADVMVAPGKAEERKINVIIPAKAESSAERTVFVKLSMQSMDGESIVGMTREYVYKREGK
ncbi:hypothetical protein V4890_23645 [Ralstonia solanacearum species complex bacterium KE056]|uniref:hypothetical protein n=1 Tax=Ralstonia solanacearum species complex bacterium KE056 TaxID=3119585 RepID=UPI002FC306F3